jgi:hypothetical protein
MENVEQTGASRGIRDRLMPFQGVASVVRASPSSLRAARPRSGSGIPASGSRPTRGSGPSPPRRRAAPRCRRGWRHPTASTSRSRRVKGLSPTETAPWPLRRSSTPRLASSPRSEPSRSSASITRRSSLPMGGCWWWAALGVRPSSTWPCPRRNCRSGHRPVGSRPPTGPRLAQRHCDHAGKRQGVALRRGGRSGLPPPERVPLRVAARARSTWPGVLARQRSRSGRSPTLIALRLSSSASSCRRMTELRSCRLARRRCPCRVRTGCRQSRPSTECTHGRPRQTAPSG